MKDEEKKMSVEAHDRAMSCMKDLLECRNNRYAWNISIVGLAGLAIMIAALTVTSAKIMALSFVVIVFVMLGAVLLSNAQHDFREHFILEDYSDAKG